MPDAVAAKDGPLAIDWDSVISAETINDVVRTLVKSARPTKVIPFGSYAKGDASDDSDIDLFETEAVGRDWIAKAISLFEI